MEDVQHPVEQKKMAHSFPLKIHFLTLNDDNKIIICNEKYKFS